MSNGRLGAVKCDRCGKLACDLKEAELYGWDWFTGYMPRTRHYCRPCQDADPVAIRQEQRTAMNKDAVLEQFGEAR